MKIILISALAGFAILSFSPGASADTPAETDAQASIDPQVAIEYLLARVADSALEFVRNGKTHLGPDAAKHMRRKYEHYTNRIHSPEDFIELAATRSMLSGKKYLVRDADGVIPTAEWLHSLLVEYRDALNDHVADTR